MGLLRSLVAAAASTTATTLSSRAAAKVMSDTDVLPVAQPSQIGGSADTLWIGTLAQLWTYMASKLPSYRIPVVELTGLTTLDSTVHNRRLLVINNSLALTLPGTFANLATAGVSFEAEVQVEAGATLTLPSTGAATITSPATVAGPAQLRLRAWTTAAGVTRFSCSSPSGGTATTNSPVMTVTGLSSLAAASTSTVSLSYSYGTPTGLTATIDGAAVTLSNVQISSTSGSGATAAGTATATLTVPAAGAHALVVSGTGTYASTSPAYAFTATAPAAVIANTLRAEGHDGDLDPAPFTLSNTYGTLKFDRGVGRRPYLRFKRVSDGTYVQDTSTTMVAGWGKSATTPPPAAAIYSGFTSTDTVNGYATLVKQGQNPLWNAAPYIVQPTGAGTVNWYFWFSEDGGQNWSVHRDTSNVAIPFPVIS